MPFFWDFWEDHDQELWDSLYDLIPYQITIYEQWHATFIFLLANYNFQL